MPYLTGTGEVSSRVGNSATIVVGAQTVRGAWRTVAIQNDIRRMSSAGISGSNPEEQMNMR